MVHYLYALVDPRCGSKRYIGYTKDLKQRFRQHIGWRPKGWRSKSPFATWLRTLRSKKVEPVLKVLCIVGDREEAKSLEVRMIASCRSRGVDLTNVSAGGDGASRPRTTREKRAIGRSKIGIPRPDWVRAKVSATRKAKFAAGAYADAYKRNNKGQFYSDKES